MRRLVKKAPRLDREFYRTGLYATPKHHVDNEPSTPRMLLAKALVEYLYKHHGDGIETVLDLGCGDGGLLELVHTPGRQFRGVDLSEPNCEYARQRLHGTGVEILNEDFTLLSPEADLVICCETMEHLEDPLALLRSLRCKYIVVSVPLGETPGQHSENHLWGWHLSEFLKMLDKVGFRMLHYVRLNTRTQLAVAEKR